MEIHGARVYRLHSRDSPGSILEPQQQYLEEMQEEMWALGDPDIAPARGGRSVARRAKSSAVEEAREREAARIRAKENTDAMNRRAAQVVPCPAAACACAGRVCRHVIMSLCSRVRACVLSVAGALCHLVPASCAQINQLGAGGKAPASAETLAGRKPTG